MDSRRSRSQADDYTLLSCKKFISEIRLILSNHYFECYFVNKKKTEEKQNYYRILNDFPLSGVIKLTVYVTNGIKSKDLYLKVCGLSA